MANKRDQNRQRRARQNRAQRAALEARTRGEVPKRPSRVAPSTAERLERTARDRPAGSDRASGDAPAAEAAPRKGGFFGGGRPRPVRPGDVPVDVDELEGSWFSRVQHVPGGRQVFMAMLMTIVVSGTLSLLPSFPAEGADPADGATETLFEVVDTITAIVILAIPLLAVGIALAFVFHPQRRRAWIFAAVMVGVMMLQTFSLLYLFVIGFLYFAVRKSSKVEGPRSLFNRPAAEDEDEDEDEDVVDDDDGVDGQLVDDELVGDETDVIDTDGGGPLGDAGDATSDGPISEGRRRFGRRS